ncbi:hypothetical protein G6F40_013742 [Rhizopus arrhizus]|nr:hypothetical protein G6F40_013742 [Rhizopus arrhizus]
MADWRGGGNCVAIGGIGRLATMAGGAGQHYKQGAITHEQSIGAAMKVVCFMFPGFTLQDMVGPVTVWSMMPEVEFEFVAAAKGEVMTDSGLAVRATHDFSDVAKAPDVLLVPGGGLPVFEAMQDDALLDAIAGGGAGAKWVTSATGPRRTGARAPTWKSSALWPMPGAWSSTATAPAAAAPTPPSPPSRLAARSSNGWG